MATLRIIRGETPKILQNDSISGMVFISDTVPPIFVNEPIHKISNIHQAEQLGIVGDYSDETKPQNAIFSLTGSLEIGDEIVLKINNAELSKYTATATIADVNTALNKIVDSVNAKTYRHGFKASLSGNDIVIEPRAGLGGITTVLSVEVPSTVTVNISQNFDLGSVSPTKIMHYLISQYFEYSENPLYIAVFDHDVYTDELTQMQNFANGEINQFAVIVLTEPLTPSVVQAFQPQAEQLFEKKTPVVITLTADLKDIGLYDDLADYSQLSSNYVNVFVGINGAFTTNSWDSTKTYKYGDTIRFLNGVYQAKYETKGSPLGDDWVYLMDNPYAGLNGSRFADVGTVLGVLSTAKVHENIGWVGKYNLLKDNFTKASIFGEQFEKIPDWQIKVLEDKNYTFFRFYPAEEGIFISDTWTAISKNNDYATLENNRTFNKAVRILAQKLNPYLNSPLPVNKDGTLKQETVMIIKSDVEAGMNLMKTNGEISNFKVVIDTTQNVLETGKLVVNITIQPVGVAREIEATLSFATTIK